MWTSKPVWLWLLEAFIERARPWVNWIGGAYVIFWVFGTFLVAELVGIMYE